MKPIFPAFCLAAALCLTACRSTPKSEAGEQFETVRQQLLEQRAQLKAAGATAAQLREFDKAMDQTEKALRLMEKQLRTLERQADKLSR